MIEDIASPKTMALTVLLFGQIKDHLGQSEITVTLPSEATGNHLKAALSLRDSLLRSLLAVSRLAVGQEYVMWDHPLRSGDEIALIPPVSGG